MQRSLSLSLNVLALAALTAVVGCSKQEPAAGASAGASGAAPAAAADAGAVEVPFGTVGPISGGIAHIGKDVENGVRLALDEANAAGVKIGGKPVHFKIVAEDDAGDPKQATAVAQKMCDSKVAAVVGHLQSGTTIPASDVYAKCGIPMITASASNPDLTKPGHKNVFRLIANDNQLGEAVAVHAAKNGVKTVAIVDDRTAFGQGLAVVFKNAADKNGMQVVANEFTTDKATDFMAILTAIKAKKPDAILFGGLDAQAGPMLRQMGQLGLDNVKLFGGDAICTEKLPELSSNSKTVENVICATGGSSVQKMDGGPDWLKGYEAKYPKQFQIYSPYAYDAARVLIEAMKAADSTDPAVYLSKLAATNFKGLTGEISFTDKGELQKPAVTLYTYKDGKRVEM
ncbi:branched-chain amino acid ABC transporter substrate-binding protein [Brachymonas denitrificans]|uniref:branched-chain amino acid ABC transporter substrate-binding protein n=1 Tax=Brachymonas denitrificans TaxID=28220 RepID=UPI001BCD5EF3|nr:branched-chain amino acid ABC transporter substrate-binding protein [Brachymonas denitrificans]